MRLRLAITAINTYIRAVVFGDFMATQTGDFIVTQNNLYISRQTNG